MGVKLPVERAWSGFCEHFAELQKQGRTIAESEDGRYRITLDARGTYAHLMVFDHDDVVYDETLITKDQFEDELVYLYDFYIESYDSGDNDEDDYEYEPVYEGSSDVRILLDELITALSPGISTSDKFYEDVREDLLAQIEDSLLQWGYPTVV